MNLLQINKFYYIHGGTDRYFFEVSKLLKRKGHNIALFSMDDRKNIRSKWSKYFVSNISIDNDRMREKINLFLRSLYSLDARNKISGLLDNFHPDAVHIHSIYHHISPSILPELEKRNIPVVMTVHDYHLISPNYNLFHNNHICEVTKPHNFYRGIFHRCVKNSYLATVAEIIEKYLHYWLGWERNYIDYFIAPSQFMRDKLIEYGIDKNKIIHLPHFIDYRQYKPNYNPGDYILYFGRLSLEKGLKYLIQTTNLLPKIKLLVVGRGSQEQELKILNKEFDNKNVEFVGFRDGYELKQIIANSRFTILPSVWYEIAPMSILESFASGKMVIASDIGGISELVKDGFNGILVRPGNVDDLVRKINKLRNIPQLCRKMNKNARKIVENNFGPQEHYDKLMQIYKMAIKKQ